MVVYGMETHSLHQYSITLDIRRVYHTVGDFVKIVVFHSLHHELIVDNRRKSGIIEHMFRPSVRLFSGAHYNLTWD